MAIGGHPERAREQTDRLISGKAGDISIVANCRPFSYGKNHWTGQDAFFFRFITDEYTNIDPLTKQLVAWMDWKVWIVFVEKFNFDVSQ